MQLSPVSNLISGLGSTQAAAKQSGDSFTDILSQAIGNAKETEGGVQTENAALLTGETDDLHTPVIEAQRAELALSLAIQVRNKVLEAYNEVMRMQV